MRTALAVAALFALAACRKDPKPEPPAPVQNESVPISNDPRQGADMIRAAERAAGQADAAGAKREAEAGTGQ